MSIKQFKKMYLKKYGYNITDFELVAMLQNGTLPKNDKLENEVINLKK